MPEANDDETKIGRGSLFEFYGITKTLAEWCDLQELAYGTVWSRIVRRKMSVKDALEETPRKMDQSYRKRLNKKPWREECDEPQQEMGGGPT